MTTNDLIDVLSMAAAWISAIAASVTVFITGYALVIARRTLHSWKEHEKFMQLVRVKRAVFAYRQNVESMTLLEHDHDKIREYISNVLQPSLTDIFHEMKLADMNEKESPEFECFNALFEAQQKHQQSHANYRELLNCAVALQEKIEVSF